MVFLASVHPNKLELKSSEQITNYQLVNTRFFEPSQQGSQFKSTNARHLKYFVIVSKDNIERIKFDITNDYG